MLIMLFEVARLLIHFLRAPQAGVPVIQTTGAGTATWVSAADMMSLMALILGMFGELTFLILSLWLLFRTAMSFVDAGVKQEGWQRPSGASAGVEEALSDVCRKGAWSGASSHVETY